MEKVLIREVMAILYNSPDKATDGEVLDQIEKYLKTRAAHLGVSLEGIGKISLKGLADYSNLRD